ncbi:cytochrome P450 [Trifolium medium]|uniref:Cytochrome P450 n=1 Tax=Trifolium medium TaxID=97028 RepID=A0A392PEU7_9FABA|nr:cytochrome P450 [Trifolium medium]
MNFLNDWKNIKSVQTATSVDMQAEMTVIKWKKPSPRRIKCNIDVAFPSNNNRIGIGIYIRDETCAFICAKTEWVEPRCEVHIGEALGFLSALQWVHELNLGLVDFERDSKLVVDSFHYHRKNFTEFGAIIQHCKVIFSSFYVNSTVDFVMRQTNEVVHALATAAPFLAIVQIMVDIPDCINTF